MFKKFVQFWDMVEVNDLSTDDYAMKVKRLIWVQFAIARMDLLEDKQDPVHSIYYLISSLLSNLTHNDTKPNIETLLSCEESNMKY